MHVHGKAWSPEEHAHAREDRRRVVELAAGAAEQVVRRLREVDEATARAAPPFAHLSVRTCYSLRDGAIRPRELTAAAAAAGMTHVAVTDRDGLYGAVRFAKAAAADGVVPVFGTDLALEPDQDRPGWGTTRAGRQRFTAEEARTRAWSGFSATRDRPSTTPNPSSTTPGVTSDGFGGRTSGAPAEPAENHRAGDRRGVRRRAEGQAARRVASGGGRRGASATADPRAVRPGAGQGWLEDDAARVQLVARTNDGWGDLCRAVSLAHGGWWSRPGTTGVASTAAHGEPAEPHTHGDLRNVRRAGAGRSDGAHGEPAEPHTHGEDRGVRPVGGGAAARAATLGNRASPHLSWEGVQRATQRGGTWVLLGRDSPVGRLLAAGRHDAAAHELRRWADLVGVEHLLLGVRNHLAKDEDRVVRATLELAQRSGVKPVAVNDVRYLGPQDTLVADVMACIRQQVPLGRRHTGRTSAEGWFKTAVDLAPLYAERPDLLSGAHEVATSCEVDLGLGELVVPHLTGMSKEVAAGELHRRAWAGTAERLPRVTPAVRERLTAELAMVDRLGLHDYFLAVADVVEGIREIGMMAACRGSAAGSLVCFALRISDVDPVRHDLAFERFMNPYRDELPDIDIDVEAARREEVYDLVIALYGEHRTSCVAMVETFQARMAIREVGRVLGFPKEELDVLAGSFTHARARDVRRAMRQLSELRGARFDEGQVTTLFDLVERIDGFPRHMAMHPCGILLADANMLDTTPLERSGAGFPMSQFDKDDVAALGLLKLDVLGVRMLSAMAHTREQVAATRDVEIDFERDADFRDPGVYRLLRSAQSIGVFQLESPGQRELLGRLQPDHFGDLVTEISLFRPGPVKADMVTPFVKRRHGEEAPVFLHAALAPALAETHGVIVYHEQVMRVLAILTGCDLSYADLLRRRMGDDREVELVRHWVVDRAVERGFDRDEVEQVWTKVASFASFGFCKAHAAAFAVPTYRSAWLKAHYLPEFVCGLLTHDPGMYPRRLILEEARNFGVATLPPDVNRSSADYTTEVVDRGMADHLFGIRGLTGRTGVLHGTGERMPDGVTLPPGWTWGDGAPLPPSGFDSGDAGNGWRWAVRIGLQDVRGITADEVEEVLANRPYSSLHDLRHRSGLSRPTAEHLSRAGAFDSVAGVGRRDGPHRRQVTLVVEELWRTARGRASARRAAEQTSLDLHAGHAPDLPVATEAERTRDELAVLGMDVTRHLVSFYEPLLEALGCVRAHELESLPNGQVVRVAGVKTAVQSPAQRSGRRVLFLTLDDRTGSTQVTYFATTLDDVAWTVLNSWIIVAEGRVSRRGRRGATVTGLRAWNMSRLWRAWQEGWLPDALTERGTPAPDERDDRRNERPEGLHASEWGRGSR